LRAQYVPFLSLPGSDDLLSRLQGINKCRAGSREIKSPNVFRAQLILNETSGRGEKHVGRNRSHNDLVEIGSVDAALGQRVLRRLDRKIAGRNTLVCKMAFADTDPLHDPLVIGIDKFFEIGVGKKARRNVGAESADLNALKLTQ